MYSSGMGFGCQVRERGDLVICILILSTPVWIVLTHWTWKSEQNLTYGIWIFAFVADATELVVNAEAV